MKTMLALAAGILGYFYYLGRTSKSTKVAVKQDLHRWEGEGGNVPAVATPSPPPMPNVAPPYVDPAMRH